jgi:hypothetical protein
MVEIIIAIRFQIVNGYEGKRLTTNPIPIPVGLEGETAAISARKAKTERIDLYFKGYSPF